MRARDASLMKFRRSKLHIDLAAYRLLRNKVSATLKRAKESYKTSLIEENSSDSESFWRPVKKNIAGRETEIYPDMYQS